MSRWALILGSWITPRVVLVFMWIGGRLAVSFDSFWTGLAGFLLLPWTTAVYAIVVESRFPGQHDVSALGWFFVVLGLLADVGTWWVGGREARRRYSVKA